MAAWGYCDWAKLRIPTHLSANDRRELGACCTLKVNVCITLNAVIWSTNDRGELGYISVMMMHRTLNARGGTGVCHYLHVCATLLGAMQEPEMSCACWAMSFGITPVCFSVDCMHHACIGTGSTDCMRATWPKKSNLHSRRWAGLNGVHMEYVMNQRRMSVCFLLL